jgi:DNA-directed RNA polymerase specialized sigma24 family protein
VDSASRKITEPIGDLLGQHPSQWLPGERLRFVEWLAACCPQGYRTSLERRARQSLDGHDIDDTEDAVQQLLAEIQEPDWPESVTGDVLQHVHWRLRTVCKRCNRRRRREPSWTESITDDDEDFPAPEADGPEARVTRAAGQEWSEEMLSRLTPGQRNTFAALLDGLDSTGRLLTSEEVAERLSANHRVSAAAVRKQMERGRRVLRADWAEEPR